MQVHAFTGAAARRACVVRVAKGFCGELFSLIQLHTLVVAQCAPLYSYRFGARRMLGSTNCSYFGFY